MVSKADFYKFQIFSFQECGFFYHGNFGTNKPRKATRQAAAILSTIIMPLVDAMPYKTITFPFRGEGFQMVLLVGTKWKNKIMDLFC